MRNKIEKRVRELAMQIGLNEFDSLDVSKIPCIEISDPEKLCKKPLVSVAMITYNHEKWLSEAIESVVTQQCSFPFELIIGEDCSTDSTRSICLEYQKKYPHIIRVLFSESNVSVRLNVARTNLRVRGEYVAFLEGDDYWIDALKLQKQYELMVQYPDALLSMAAARVSNASQKFGMKDGLILCPDAKSGTTLTFYDLTRFYLHTSTYFFARRGFDFIQELSKTFSPNDAIISYFLASLSSVPFLKDVVSVYRITDRGIYTGASLAKRTKLELCVALALLSIVKGYNNYLCNKFSIYMAKYLIALKDEGVSTVIRIQHFWLALKIVTSLDGLNVFRRLTYVVRMARRIVS